ncbi:MAG: hypothetical protein KME38_24190 [Spirirestis rafaelensis WJT71-NPBG6]|nr:hypothetical protein [Spirirestis rafaelensis WJT71-NPBG6]
MPQFTDYTENTVSEGKGIPVYLDKIKRKFADSVLEQMEVTDWHPSDVFSMHLWRCFEALKDIANLLHGTAILNGEQERRRRIKILVTPLYSLCVAIRDLYNYLSSSSELKNEFGKKIKKGKGKGGRGKKIKNFLPPSS